MTAVVGIMNKRGIAIAADSAVTITRPFAWNPKIANSANKMLRLSSAQPISVMITGNACFLNTPWDVIVRRYRQKWGDKSLPTVEACVNDFFRYIPTEEQLFPKILQTEYIEDVLKSCFDDVSDDMACEGLFIMSDPNQILKSYHSVLEKRKKALLKRVVSPSFIDYPFSRFKEFASEAWERFSEKLDTEPDNLLEEIKDELLEMAMLSMTTRNEEGGTTLVFSGFGGEEDFPTLIAAEVNHGFDGRVNYHIDDKNVIRVSDKTPAAICPFAQTDIMEALLTGVNPLFKEEAVKRSVELLERLDEQIAIQEGNSDEIWSIINKVKYKDLIRKFSNAEEKRARAARQVWIEALKDYDLQDMAQLAENLVAMTGFERHMTFKNEGVGGPIDLAVITKNNGFTWLNRKSWYHRKDVGGVYGKFGV